MKKTSKVLLIGAGLIIIIAAFGYFNAQFVSVGNDAVAAATQDLSISLPVCSAESPVRTVTYHGISTGESGNMPWSVSGSSGYGYECRTCTSDGCGFCVIRTADGWAKSFWNDNIGRGETFACIASGSKYNRAEAVPALTGNGLFLSISVFPEPYYSQKLLQMTGAELNIPFK